MADIVKKDGNGPQTQPQGAQRNQPQVQRGSQGELVSMDPLQMMMRDPYQLMRDLMWDPFGMLQQMIPMRGMGREMVWNPNFEVRETDDAFVFKADLPGITTDDIEISVTGKRIRISGKREHEQASTEGTMHTFERSYGNFVRSFSLPDAADLDKISCDLKNGVLTMLVPKRAGSAQQTKKIQIGGGSKA